MIYTRNPILLLKVTILIVHCIHSSCGNTLNRRGNSGNHSPSHQSQTVSFGSFQGLLELDPKEFEIVPESDFGDSASSRSIHHKENKQISSSHHPPIPNAPKETTQSLQSSKHDRAGDKVVVKDPVRLKLDEINAKRRKDRAEFKAKYPLIYQKKLRKIAQETKAKNQRRKSLGLPIPIRKPGLSKTRKEIRKRVREGQGTKEDQEYLNDLRIKNQLYRKRKKEEKQRKNRD